MAREGECFEAFAVIGGRFAAVGSEASFKGWDAAERIDLGGSTVLPGMIDSHLHLSIFARTLSEVYLGDCRSIGEVVQKLSERASTVSEGGWIVGGSLDDEKLIERRMPNRLDLDLASSNHPILISRCCLHMHAANSLAMDLAGLTASNEDSGLFETFPDGTLNGILRETAVSSVINIIPDICARSSDAKNLLARTLALMSSRGLTGIHCLPGYPGESLDRFSLLQELRREGRLPIRLYMCSSEYPSFGMSTGFGDDMLRYGFYKIFSDGSLGARDAAMLNAYSDDPGNSGTLFHTQEELVSLMRKAYDMDVQIGIHAIGDRGVEAAISAFEAVYRENEKKDPRFRLIHASVTNQEQIERMKRLPLMIDIQPAFATSADIDWMDARVGPERAKYAYPFRTFIDNGVLLAGGSDCPVETFDPFFGIYGAVNRQAADGHPEGGFYPQERLSVYEAISLYTKNAAYASFEESIKGTVEEGKLADFIVIKEDPFEIDPKRLKDIEVEKTYLGGELMPKP
jgi:predicted amidohydrolase YtcJ